MSGHVLITGAYGFLGRHTARLFAERGYVVTGIGHGCWSDDQWRQWGMSSWCEADVTAESLRGLSIEPDVLIHAAGSGSVAFSSENPLADFDRTVKTTAHVLEYLRTEAAGCRLVYPSSASVYGNVDQVPIAEDCPTRPISQYGTHKLLAEQLVSLASCQRGLQASIVRFFSIYGSGLRKQLLWDACGKFNRDEPTFMGTGDETRDWLHVEDAATLIFVAAEHAAETCPTVNGGSGEGIRVKELLTHLGQSLGSKAPPSFSGVGRRGDPLRYVAAVDYAHSWGWRPQHGWKDGVREYAAWWMVDAA